jgi:hypothetical protein
VICTGSAQQLLVFSYFLTQASQWDFFQAGGSLQSGKNSFGKKSKLPGVWNISTNVMVPMPQHRQVIAVERQGDQRWGQFTVLARMLLGCILSLPCTSVA